VSSPQDDLQQALGYDFRDGNLLDLALAHSSYASENELLASNERLEFLGDAVLQLAVTDQLHAAYPELAEGQMAKIRAAVVSEPPLAEFARQLGLGDALLLGRGENATGGRAKDSILSDAMEAVLGAVYLDGGYDSARRVVLDHWVPLIAERVRAPGERDYKTRLQELLAQEDHPPPQYLLEESGPDHAKEFTARVIIDGAELGRGDGTSKKRAQQGAARAALDALAAAS